ncbi:type II toxin-antitoxin system RnlB family antitoxin [Kineothrix sp. MB12-C1]|uniref:type II toxin-antitoxin system RnlB family antitoxin n=1 Tax=Kineothrix sp. MB12-C1 TaxID=3070215 RepID=UPI0027D3397F|nr:type II toxin-antitoxin system RnlB family antitoxin [Kineothrix sp. MB12-C1]WMC91305.1 type II toxin-antitoxin system RnlB family antitoxin [Kineothrix sp. MB12-C1]
MKDNFKILKLNNEPYDFLIIATSYENPLDSIEEIEEEIHVKKANLLFDLTLINGVKKNRYIKCEYKAGINKLQSCSLVDSIDETIKALSYNFFKQNEEVVRKSIIPNTLKHLIKSGLI